MAIYFVQAGNGGPVKIGYASDIALRINRMQPMNHEELRLLGWMPGEWVDEAPIHRQFSADRIRGEWFRPSEVLIAFIRNSCSLTPIRRLLGKRRGSMSTCSTCGAKGHDKRVCPVNRPDLQGEFYPGLEG